MKTSLISFLLTIVLVGMVAPSSSAAQSRDWSRVDTSDLDDDIVDTFKVPVLFSVTPDDLVADFGDPRGGGTREHEGQDMFAPEGTPIVSPTEAVVLRTGTGSSAGKYVYTANPGGEVFRYMHLETIANIERGDELDVGDFIGTMGDTGNAPDGVHHLHFEVRDEDNDATDPFDRLTEAFTTEEQMEALDNLFRNMRNDEEYAQFLVEAFPDAFAEALREDYDLPRVIEEALENTGLVEAIDRQAQLVKLMDTIPILLPRLQVGDTGAAVILLQLYVMFDSTGTERDALARAGATGYYGPVTAAAVRTWQVENDVTPTGLWTSMRN